MSVVVHGLAVERPIHPRLRIMDTDPTIDLQEQPQQALLDAVLGPRRIEAQPLREGTHRLAVGGREGGDDVLVPAKLHARSMSCRRFTSPTDRTASVSEPATMRRPHLTAIMRPVDRTILIVDDHAGFRRSVRALLQAEGLDVVGEAMDGATALTETARLAPALVLLDIQLPDIDGFAVAALLGRRPTPPKVILISSRDAASYGDRIRSAGALGFIAKSQLSGAAIAALLE